MRLLAICLLIASAQSLRAQAAVEYGLGAANASGMSGVAGSIGKKVSGIADTAGKTIHTATPAPQAAAEKPAEPAPVYEDLSNLETGISFADVVRRFGPATLTITSSAGQILTYSTSEGMTLADVRHGIVESVHRPRK